MDLEPEKFAYLNGSVAARRRRSGRSASARERRFQCSWAVSLAEVLPAMATRSVVPSLCGPRRVGMVSCSINCSERYSGGVGGGMRLRRARLEVALELGQETLCGPRAGLAKGANGAARDVIRHVFQRAGIAFHAAAGQEAVGDLLHPERALAAGGALAAALVRVKFVDIIQRPDHVARVVQHDHAAGAGHGAHGRERIEIHDDVVQPDLPLSPSRRPPAFP